MEGGGGIFARMMPAWHQRLSDAASALPLVHCCISCPLHAAGHVQCCCCFGRWMNLPPLDAETAAKCAGLKRQLLGDPQATHPLQDASKVAAEGEAEQPPAAGAPREKGAGHASTLHQLLGGVAGSTHEG